LTRTFWIETTPAGHYARCFTCLLQKQRYLLEDHEATTGSGHHGLTAGAATFDLAILNEILRLAHDG